MSKRIVSKNQAFSPVISVVIISAVVIAIGGGIWAFSQGATTITAEDYAEGVINMTDTISERFIIEHVSYNGTYLHVWVYNYGVVDIEFKVQIGEVNYTNWIDLASKDMVPVEPKLFSAVSGDGLNIKVYSRRGNDAYYRYLVP